MEKMRQWTILTALGVVGVLAAGWFLMVSPQSSHAKQLRTQATSVEDATRGLQTQISQLKEQAKGQTAQQKRLMDIATQIPDNPQLPALIRQLSAAAHKSGVSLDSMAPSTPAPVAVAASTAGGAGAGVPLSSIPVVISVTGSYFNIESFVRALEHLDRALKTTGLTVAPNSGGAAASGNTGAAPNALTGQIQAVVYESPSVVPAATAQTAAPAKTTTTQSTTGAPAATDSTTTPAQSDASEK
jgi:Tfp pilus assembly protein PilO